MRHRERGKIVHATVSTSYLPFARRQVSSTARTDASSAASPSGENPVSVTISGEITVPGLSRMCRNVRAHARERLLSSTTIGRVLLVIDDTPVVLALAVSVV